MSVPRLTNGIQPEQRVFFCWTVHSPPRSPCPRFVVAAPSFHHPFSVEAAAEETWKHVCINQLQHFLSAFFFV